MSENVSGSVIRAIDPSSVHRICSGQVIIDLSTAVKELIENSLDAGATTIDIRLKEYGSELIEVSDNGTGVAKEDRQVLMKKYYTSKLSKFEDLEQVCTFGFRGEALSSLCSMSHVTAVTKVQGEECGVTLEFDPHGNLVQETLTARSVGTTISVQDLFHSLPVRHKEFKKNIKRDYSKLVTLLHAYSLAHTNVRMVCTNQVGNGTARSIVLSTQHGNHIDNGDSLNVESARVSARMLFGKKVADMFIPVNEENKELGIKIEGLVSGTGIGSGSGKGNSNFFYVNKRPIQFPKAGSVLNETYKSFISPAQTQKPICILNFCVRTDTYDVNVTPDKRKVFFHHEMEICRFLQDCLSRVWDAQRSTYTVQKVIENKCSQYVEQRIDHMFTPQPRPEAVKDVSLATSITEPSSLTKREVPTVVPSPSSQEKKRVKSIFDYAIDAPLERPKKLSKDLVDDGENRKTTHADTDGVEVDAKATFLSQQQNLEVKEMQEERNEVVEESSDEEEEGNQLAQELEGDGKIEIQVKPTVHVEEMSSHEYDVICTSLTDKGNETGSTDDDSKENGGVQGDVVSTMIDREESINIQQEITACNEIEKTNELHCDIKEIRSAVLERARMLLAKSQEAKHAQKISFQVASMTKQVDTFEDQELSEQDAKATDELQRVFHKGNFTKLKIIGQFNLGFIIAKLGDDLFIIDQHASDEKFTFENLQKTTKFRKQRLIKPIKLSLSPQEDEIVRENMDTFSNSGFEFQESTDGSLHVISVPHWKGITFGAADILEMIDMIERGERSLWHLEASSSGHVDEECIHAVYPSRFKALLASKACRTSIMIGKPLTVKKMEEIVHNLATLVSPWNCPHGRPTMRHLAYVPKQSN